MNVFMIHVHPVISMSVAAHPCRGCAFGAPEIAEIKRTLMESPLSPIPKGLEIWTAQTLCDIGILLSLVSFMLHVGRSYFERIQSRLTLRVGADLWWMMYVLLRDGTLFLALLAGLLNLNLDLMADIKIGLPFVPLGTVAIAVALVIKVFGNSEDLGARGFKLSFLFVILGTVLNLLGYVLVMECPGDEYTKFGTMGLRSLEAWRSNQNPELATVTFYIAIALLAAIGAVATFKALGLFARAGKDGSANVSD